MGVAETVECYPRQSQCTQFISQYLVDFSADHGMPVDQEERSIRLCWVVLHEDAQAVQGN